MIATVINALLVILGSIIGMVFGKKTKGSYLKTINAALAMCVAVIGVQSALGTAGIIVVIGCLVVGTLIGELLKIDDRIEKLGDFMKAKIAKHLRSDTSRFSEGFVTGSLFFCIGSMAIMGTLEAGISHNYSIILAKSVIDFASAIAFAATMGIGVAFSSILVFVYQGILTVLAGIIGPYLGTEVVAEMSAVGGIMLLCIAANMIEITKERIKVANMLPAMFLPIAYFPLKTLIENLIAKVF